jgi:hypothetical protein
MSESFAHATFVFAKIRFWSWFSYRVDRRQPIKGTAASPSANSVDTPGPGRHGLA